MSSNVNVYDAPLRTAGVFDTTTTSGGNITHTHRRISWAAIFGGVILVVSVQLLLSLLGAGIGLGTVNTNLGSTPTASNLVQRFQNINRLRLIFHLGRNLV
jgi:hypothetical protein